MKSTFQTNRPRASMVVLALQQSYPLTAQGVRLAETAVAEMHPTMQLIHQRHSQGSLPGHRTDGLKLGLVVEGGGMQGIISGGMLCQITRLGLSNVFDVVYGSSAGAINACYYLSGQNEGLDVYTEDLVDGRFLNLSKALVPAALRRYWATSSGSGSSSSGSSSDEGDAGPQAADRPAMDLSYLLVDVMQHKRPLLWDRVLSSPVPLKVVASSLDQMRPIILDAFKSKDDLVECLMASATVPEFAGPPRLVRGQRCVDAAVFEPVPLQTAINDGCSHTLVLCTRLPATGSRSHSVYSLAKKAIERVVKSTVLNADYMASVWSDSRSDVSYIHDELLFGALHGCPYESYDELGAYVLPLYPRSVRGINAVCTDVRKLRAARAEGQLSVQHQLGRPLGLRPLPGR